MSRINIQYFSLLITISPVTVITKLRQIEWNFSRFISSFPWNQGVYKSLKIYLLSIQKESFLFSIYIPQLNFTQNWIAFLQLGLLNDLDELVSSFGIEFIDCIKTFRFFNLPVSFKLATLQWISLQQKSFSSPKRNFTNISTPLITFAFARQLYFVADAQQTNSHEKCKLTKETKQKAFCEQKFVSPGNWINCSASNAHAYVNSPIAAS